MTEREAAGDGWPEALARICRASGHELRNSLNALVVNLEVVRSRVSDPATQPFIDQAVRQSEESVRLTEASIALLNLVVSAVHADGSIDATPGEHGEVRLTAVELELERTVRALSVLADRGAVRVDTSDTTVILSIPETTESATTE